MNKVIHVFIADDSIIHIEGVKTILKYEDTIVVSGEGYTCEEVKQQLQQGIPMDILLLDISLEEAYDGLELARTLSLTHPHIKIIILSHYKETLYIIKALNAKVRAYLAKDSSPSDVIHAIRTVMSGSGIYFGETVSYDTLLKGFGSPLNIKKGKPYELSERELEVLQMIAEGYAAKEIATVLHINVNTVESHKEHIKNKLGVNSIIEAVVLGVKHNLW